MIGKNIYTIMLVSGFVSIKSFSQNMNSPYSIYGIGDIDNRIYNRTSGMGGTGLATQSSSYFINNNPAAISGLPRSFYLLSVSATGKTLQYYGDAINETNRKNKDLWLKGLTLAVKINKFWASSIGFKQFSNVNYKFSGNKNVLGSNEIYYAIYEGNGGLNDYYWTNAFSVGKHFSFGIKSSIIAGSINQTETIVNDAATSSIETKQQDYFGSPKFEFGAIYSVALNKKWDFSLGGKFIEKTRLGSERTLTVTENGAAILNDNFIKNDRFYLPRTYGMGITLTHNKKTSFAADYTYENWSPLNIKGDGWSLINSNRISAGIEIAKHIDVLGQKVEKNYFQFGGFISNSYLRVNNMPVNEFGITAGMGGRLNSNLLYTLSLEGGKRGTTKADLIKENFLQLTLSLTYRDFLFSKGRKYD
ncbi:MAG TPA: hypothetical protein VGQ09_06595 [Chitinophagaceae bacterium]|jgi:hypothetical protein|nr:hypothetical protein [Chitinophagaceae bacterium]